MLHIIKKYTNIIVYFMKYLYLIFLKQFNLIL